MEELAALGTVKARSHIITTAPIGPAQRRFANAACIIESEYDPESLLAGLKMMEREFGRRSGQRWGDRVLDLDVILWSGGAYESRALNIPHKEFRDRNFVLSPASQIGADWRDPVTGLSIANHYARLRKPKLLVARQE
jgi:2-amino-4-hydroxy-6-hydroxymethyldihydropteridine diphosphokinase